MFFSDDEWATEAVLRMLARINHTIDLQRALLRLALTVQRQQQARLQVR